MKDIFNNSLNTTKIIYHTNTLSIEDDERVRKMINLYFDVSSQDKQSRGRNFFIFDCSLCGDLRYDSLSTWNYINPYDDIIEAFFRTECFKEVRFVCDTDQYSIINNLKENKLPVPVPKKIITINEQNRKMHKNKDNDSKMSYNGVATPANELKGDVALWIIAYTIPRRFSRV